MYQTTTMTPEQIQVLREHLIRCARNLMSMSDLVPDQNGEDYAFILGATKELDESIELLLKIARNAQVPRLRVVD